jgi:thiol-disulfide isomerase/thioredoxin
MPDSLPLADTSDPRLQSLLAEYEAALASGQPLSIPALLARHTDVEPEVVAALVKAVGRLETLALTPVPTDGGPSQLTLSTPQAAIAACAAVGGTFGDYELLEEIARGGMGVVFKARQKSIGRIVALKMILSGTFASPEQVRRFHFEAEEAGRLDHPHIVPIYQVGEHESQHYFSMRLVEGGSLSQHGGRFRTHPNQAVRLIATVARAVDHAHQRGVLHRDLKPGNILLDSEGQPHITDFGLAKDLGAKNSDTQSGAIVGTPSYMAPEQAAARKDLSTAVDVYALGAILFDLLTGRPPFHADTPLETVMQVLEHDPPRPRSLNAAIDADLETICLKCLEKDPARRYRSAEDLAQDLERYLQGDPIRARPAGRIERVRKWVRRRPAMAALVVVVAAGILGLLVLGWYDNRKLKRAWEQAEANATEAEANAVEARQQRDEANAGFRKRQDTLDALLVRLDRRLETLGPAISSVRMEFLAEFRKLNDELMQERGHEPAVRRQAGQLLERIADLEATRNDTAAGEQTYKKAIELYSGLAKEGIANQDDRIHLAYNHAQLAQLHRRARRYPEAKATYEEAIRLRERLVADFPQNWVHRYRTASYRFLLGDLLDDQEKNKEAEVFYRKALAEQEKLVKDFPDQGDARQSLLDTAGSLAVLLEPTKPEETQQLLERIHREQCAIAQANPGSTEAVINSGYDLADHLKRRGRHGDILRLASETARTFSTSPDLHYHVACFTTRAILALDADRTIAPAERDRLGGTYAAQAVQLLQRAVQLGWKARDHMFLDGDLDALRGRADFRDMLAELDKRLGKPLTTEYLVNYLAQRYRSEQMQAQMTRSNARTVAERKKAGANLPKPEEYAERFLSLAEEHPKDAAAVTALAQVLAITSSPALASSKSAGKLRARAFSVMERDHLQTPAFVGVCESLAETPTQEGDHLLRTAFEKHALAEVRGQAGFWLARSLARQAQNARAVGSADESVLFQQAEKQFECIIRDHGSVVHGTTTLGEAARTQLHALRYLSIGRPAEEITGEDLEGRAMKLSEFRGKVVLLDFWANWCGFCRQMYPYEKALAQRLRGQPFALVGVNCDSNKKELQGELKRHDITWRSWWDGNGQISRRWQMEALPLIFLIDHKGVIRQRFNGLTRGEVLDAAIDKLLAEVPKDGTKRQEAAR